MTLSFSGTPAATGVETLVSALPYLSPAEWALAAVGGFVVGAVTVLLARVGRRPRPDMVSRELADLAERHRASDRGGADVAVLADGALFIVAIAGLATLLVSPDPLVQWAGAAVAVGCSLAAMGLGWILDR